MDTIKAATKIIKGGIALLPDEAKGDYRAQASDIFIDEAINNACEALDGDEEKTAMLCAYAVQEANRVVTTLWRLEILPEEMEKEYRTLPTMKEMADAYNKFTSDRKERLDKIMEQYNAIHAEEKDLDIFKGIINGISADESEKRYDEFQEMQKQAMAGR